MPSGENRRLVRAEYILKWMITTFADLGLPPALLATVTDVGYEAPTPIQARTIPALLAGRDVIGQAQTGTGKTAAFALPILQQLDLARAEVQGLVLTPTRELAIQIQVAEAIHTYGKALGAVRVLPVYGGQGMHEQVKHLHAGVHVVVGTPGRVMDHLRETLELDALRIVVLDEGDEMLPWASSTTSSGSSANARRASDRAVLGHHAACHPEDRRAPPARPRDHRHRDQDAHRAHGRAALSERE